MQPVTPPVKQVHLPQTNKQVFIQLVQRNAALTAYGIDLFNGIVLDKHVLAFNSHNPLQHPYLLGLANQLGGFATDCFGVVFSAVDVQLKLYCEFLVDGTVIDRSNTAEISLTKTTPHRAFHIQCSFV
jgi:hypothetical protein